MKRILSTLKEKWPEYLLEILVLIIGIYGAFAVDSWNENRQKESQKVQALNQMVNELEQDHTFLDMALTLTKKRIAYLEDIQSGIPRSLDSLARAINATNPFVGINSKYLSLKNGNQLSIISDDLLLDQIVDYYESEYSWLDKWSNYYMNTVERNIEPYVFLNFPIDKNELTDPVIASQMLNRVEVQNFVSIQILIMNEITERYARSLEKVNKLKGMIETELAK